jgi:hypothetical protein
MKRDGLLAALVACTIATLVHHVHNAEFLETYPNMPTWVSPELVYLAWLGATAVGIGGYLLMRAGARRSGACALLLYAAYALDGLLHYLSAPVSDHTPTMNTTIVLEAAAGAVLFVAVLRRVVSQ